MTTTQRLSTGLALTLALLGAASCAGMIDERATLDPRVMDSMGVESARQSNYPRGSANPNPQF